MSAKSESASPKKAKSSGKAKRKMHAAEHPKVSEMVLEALTNLREKSGSSLQAIKKYISSNFAVDVEKIAPFIRRYIKSQVNSGALVQTKGKGASGSFKLSGGGSAVASEPRKRPSAAVRAAAAAATPRSPKLPKTQKAPKSLAKEKTKRSPKKAKAPKPKKASPKKGKRGGSTPKQETAA